MAFCVPYVCVCVCMCVCVNVCDNNHYGMVSSTYSVKHKTIYVCMCMGMCVCV